MKRVGTRKGPFNWKGNWKHRQNIFSSHKTGPYVKGSQGETELSTMTDINHYPWPQNVHASWKLGITRVDEAFYENKMRPQQSIVDATESNEIDGLGMVIKYLCRDIVVDIYSLGLL